MRRVRGGRPPRTAREMATIKSKPGILQRRPKARHERARCGGGVRALGHLALPGRGEDVPPHEVKLLEPALALPLGRHNRKRPGLCHDLEPCFGVAPLGPLDGLIYGIALLDHES